MVEEDKEHAKFMQLAIDMAHESVQSGEGGPFGAVIVKDGQVVYAGHNEVLKRTDPTAHAEVTVIRGAAAKLGDVKFGATATMYTSCYPCPMCLGACLWAGLTRVYYAASPDIAAEYDFDDRAFYNFFARHDDARCQLIAIAADDVRRPFDAWHQKEDRQPY